jgi:hypothetical protein
VSFAFSTRVQRRAQTRMTLSDGPYPAGRDHAEAGCSAAFDNLAGACRRINPDWIGRNRDDG